MELTRQQIESALAHALPDARLRDAAPLGDDYALRLIDGEALVLRRYPQASPEPAALQLLEGAEVPAPRLVAAGDPRPLGVPFALLSPVEGRPLADVLPQLPEAERYAVGRQLGAIVARLHTLRAPRYGALVGDDALATDDERSYVLGRLEQALDALGGGLGAATRTNLRRWFADFVDTNRPPALVHGGLAPERVLVRRSGERWVVSGLLGWGAAQGWSPGWDHAGFLDASSATDAFALRVGYGEGYEEDSERAYQQLREHALAPYRLIRNLERAAAHPDERQRRIRLVEAMLAALLTRPDDDDRFEPVLSA